MTSIEKADTARGPRHRRDHGFTLLEIMIAVAIIGFGFTALLGLHGKNIRDTIRNQNLTRATLMARDLVSNLQFQANIKGLDSLGNMSGSLEEPGYTYEIEVVGTELDNVKRATVRVIFDPRSPHACEVIYFVRGQVG